jgi:hypothetical protein
MAEATELAAIQYAEDPAVFTIATEEDIPGIYDVLISLWDAPMPPQMRHV